MGCVQECSECKVKGLWKAAVLGHRVCTEAILKRGTNVEQSFKGRESPLFR